MTTNSSQTYPRFWLIIVLLLTFFVGILLGIKLQTQKKNATIQSSKLEEVFRYTESWYVDKIDRDQLIQKVIDRITENKVTFSKKVVNSELNTIIPTINQNYIGSGLDAVIIADTLLLLKSTKIGNGLIYKPY